MVKNTSSMSFKKQNSVSADRGFSSVVVISPWATETTGKPKGKKMNRITGTNTDKFSEETQKKWKKKMFWWFLIVNVLITIIAITTIVINPQNELNVGYITIAVQLLYAALSIKIVGPTELGGILLFGDPRCEVESGLVIVPFGICELRKETITNPDSTSHLGS